MRCSCGRWEFRDASLSTGLAAVERWCPRCQRSVLLCFRGGELLAVVELGLSSDHAARIETALRSSGFLADEQRLLVDVARLMARVPRA